MYKALWFLQIRLCTEPRGIKTENRYSRMSQFKDNNLSGIEKNEQLQVLVYFFAISII
jgi:hypothetical protein